MSVQCRVTAIGLMAFWGVVQRAMGVVLGRLVCRLGNPNNRFNSPFSALLLCNAVRVLSIGCLYGHDKGGGGSGVTRPRHGYFALYCALLQCHAREWACQYGFTALSSSTATASDRGSWC